MDFEVSTALQLPESERVAAGIGVFQNQNYWYFFGTRRHANQQQLFLEQDCGHGAAILASVTIPVAGQAPQLMRLKVTGSARHYSFLYAGPDDDWRALIENDDGVFLSTDVAGGFVGTVLGPYARAE
jgi:alpha-N-arabinofuranosidase